MMSNMTIDARFRAVARASASKVALLCGESRLTYAELELRSDALAQRLRALGIERGQRVGLYAQRSIDAIVAILGILKAGAAYVPFDPAYPPKLLEFIYRDCAPQVMLVQSALLAQVDAAAASPFWTGPALDIAAAAAGAVAPVEAAARASAEAEDPAYVMYTSGSTGHPKGVLIPHRGVIRLVVDNDFAVMGADQVHLQLAPLAFDASTFEIWGALLNGAALAIVPLDHPSLDDIAAVIGRHQVTTAWLTAGLFHLMVDHRVDGLAPLRQLLAGGDVLSPARVRAAQAALPHCQLINGYGPTENTTFTCCYRIPRGTAEPASAAAPIPIGIPIEHTDVYVLGEDGAPAQEGELFAGGAGLALGYLNRDELTAERFVRNPFDGSGRSKLYRTGDRVRRRADGNLDFLGRVDRQIKVNGKRVELDEIEAVLRRCPLVEEAAAVSPPPAEGSRRVHAYVKFRAPESGTASGPGTAASAVAGLRAFLKEHAADYMMPATITAMDAMPLSPTGKIDRAKLPSPAEPASPAAANASGGSEIERGVLAIWRRVLGRHNVGLDDNFFDLGGTSLQLLEVHARIAATIRSDISVVDLFQYPRISALARRLSGSGEAAGGLRSDDRARRAQAALELARARAASRRSLR